MLVLQSEGVSLVLSSSSSISQCKGGSHDGKIMVYMYDNN